MTGHDITLAPASRRISAACAFIAVRRAEQRWNFNISASSAVFHGTEEMLSTLPAS